MNELDRLIEESLRHRASAVAAVPKGYADVNRRIVRRRRRTASMATAAVTLPALAAMGWAVTRPEPASTGAGGPADTELLGASVPAATMAFGDTLYRCTGAMGADGVYDYYAQCELVDAPGGFVLPTYVLPTYVDPTYVDPTYVDTTYGGAAASTSPAFDCTVRTVPPADTAVPDASVAIATTVASVGPDTSTPAPSTTVC